MSAQIRTQVASAVKACEDKKGEEISILEMDKNSSAFTDYFVICSGKNPRQIQAIADEIESRLKREGVPANQVEGYNQADWVLLDYVDFVVHIFSEAARKFYDLERLWKSARKLSLNDLRKPATRARKTTNDSTSAKSAKSSTTRRSGRKPATRARSTGRHHKSSK